MKTKYVEPKAYMNSAMKRAYNDAVKTEKAKTDKTAGKSKKK